MKTKYKTEIFSDLYFFHPQHLRNFILCITEFILISIQWKDIIME